MDELRVVVLFSGGLKMSPCEYLTYATKITPMTAGALCTRTPVHATQISFLDQELISHVASHLVLRVLFVFLDLVFFFKKVQDSVVSNRNVE